MAIVRFPTAAEQRRTLFANRFAAHVAYRVLLTGMPLALDRLLKNAGEMADILADNESIASQFGDDKVLAEIATLAEQVWPDFVTR